MGDVRQISGRGLHLRRNCECALDSQVRRVRQRSQSVDNQRTDRADLLNYLGGHIAAVAQIGDEFLSVDAEQVTVHERMPMWYGQWRDRCFAEREWPADHMRLRFQVTGKRILRFECKSKHAT